MFSSLQSSQEQENLKVSNMDCGDHVNSTWIVEGLQAVLITQVCGFCFFPLLQPKQDIKKLEDFCEELQQVQNNLHSQARYKTMCAHTPQA